MSQKQRQASALKRQLENFQRDIRKERENIRACEEDFKIARDDNERLQIQTQKAAYEASVQVLEEDAKTMADVLKGLNEKEKEREEQIDREVQERFESMSMAERGAAGGDLGGTSCIPSICSLRIPSKDRNLAREASSTPSCFSSFSR